MTQIFFSNYKNRKQPSARYITTYSGTKLREIAICTSIFFNLFSLFQYFLDRLYTSRISSRMLINQHTALFTELENVRKNSCTKNCDSNFFFKFYYLYLYVFRRIQWNLWMAVEPQACSVQLIQNVKLLQLSKVLIRYFPIF